MDDTTTDGTGAAGTAPDPELRAAEAAVMARLRAADPALMASTDLRALREHVATRAAEPVTIHPIAASAEHRRSRWLQVAAVAAGVIVVAGTGFTAGRMDRPAAPAADSSVADHLSATKGGEESSAEMDGPSGVDRGDDAATGSGWTSAGHTVFTSQGLSAAGTTSHAYAFDSSTGYAALTAATIAATFGVGGEPREESGSWLVGAADGNSPTVSLSSGGLMAFSFYDPGRSPWCTPSEGSGSGVGSLGDDTEVNAPATTSTVCTGSGGPAPSSEAAIDQVKAAVTQLGADVGSMSFSASPATNGAGDSSTYASVDVSITLLVNGLVSDVTWSATVTADGIQSMSGSLATVADLGEYRVVSPTEAVERLGDSRFGVINTIYPAVALDLPSSPTTTDGGGGEPSPSARLSAGALLPWSVATAVIVEAQLGMVTVYPDQGGALLLPVWNLTDSTGVVWTTLAVADDQLDMSGR